MMGLDGFENEVIYRGKSVSERPHGQGRCRLVPAQPGGCRSAACAASASAVSLRGCNPAGRHAQHHRCSESLCVPHATPEDSWRANGLACACGAVQCRSLSLSLPLPLLPQSKQVEQRCSIVTACPHMARGAPAQHRNGAVAQSAPSASTGRVGDMVNAERVASATLITRTTHTHAHTLIVGAAGGVACDVGQTCDEWQRCSQSPTDGRQM